MIVHVVDSVPEYVCVCVCVVSTAYYVDPPLSTPWGEAPVNEPPAG